jgi:hypothetical protein
VKPPSLRTAAALSLVVLLAALWPVEAQAQRRGVVRVAPRPVVVVGAYYRPLYYDPFFYDPFFYDPWYRGRYGWYPYGYQRGYAYADASVRLRVTPREAEVFVDGYYAGIVDDFDGTFQRLHLEPGDHEIQLYLAGHRPVSQKVYLQPGRTFDIRLTMEPIAAGEPEPVRPAPSARAAAAREGQRVPAPGRDPRVPRGREPRPPVDPATGVGSEFGSITFQVQPADAEVLIDGERWQGPRADEALVVQVAAGRHRVEIRKDGYQPFTSEVEVASGQTLPINVSLPRQE